MTPIIDSFYNQKYPSHEWKYGLIEYEYANATDYEEALNRIKINTHLKSSKHYGIRFLIDSSCNIIHVSYFIEGWD